MKLTVFVEVLHKADPAELDPPLARILVGTLAAPAPFSRATLW